MMRMMIILLFLNLLLLLLLVLNFHNKLSNCPTPQILSEELVNLYWQVKRLLGMAARKLATAIFIIQFIINLNFSSFLLQQLFKILGIGISRRSLISHFNKLFYVEEGLANVDLIVAGLIYFKGEFLRRVAKQIF